MTKILFGGYRFVPFVLIFASFESVWFGAMWSLSRVRNKSIKTTQESIAKSERSIFSLSVQQAQEKATELLNDPKKISFILAKGAEEPILQRLAPLQRHFFQKFETVGFVCGDARLSRSEIAPSVYNKRYLKIGSDILDLEYVAIPGSEEIYELERIADEEKVVYPSIYHLLLSIADDIYGGD